MDEYKDLVLSMYSHSRKELDAMFDSGVFNELVKGYMAMALDNGNVEHDKVMEHLKCLDTVFSEVSASEIREFYKNY